VHLDAEVGRVVNPDSASARARRYLLGELTEDERALVEQEFFRNEEAVDRIEQAEGDLIEDYLAGRLDADAHQRFERDYLAAPHHRTRVDIVRRLMTGAGQSAPQSAMRTAARSAGRGTAFQWLILAAAATRVAAAAGTLWILRESPNQKETTVDNRPPAASGASHAPAPQADPRVVALSLSPISVRGAADSPTLVIPAGTDIVALKLEGETRGAPLRQPRIIIRTVAGDEVWRGPAIVVNDLGPGILARAEIPAARLRADDFIVTLFDTDAAGYEHERSRYVLRVRTATPTR
jgi:hypothetical protein